MDLGLQDRVAFVAGASSGLGLAAALALASEGCSIAICSRDQGRVNAAAGELAETVGPDRVLAVECDVTDEDQVRYALGRTAEHYGALHILITNAGGPPTGFIDEFSADTWRMGLELNLVSTINMCRHALPYLREAARTSGLARILMITSIAAKQPVPSLYLSNTARAGVQGFAKTLSEEVGPAGITVNTILPGFTRTVRLQELVDQIQDRSGQSPEEIEAGWAAGAALNRLAEPEEFAAVAAFLCSARAGYVTGAAIPVDGGYTKHLL